ncbi:stage III sporulation protein AG [Salipaludibacillus daqingensis]|uniref:stage III sporulation protein AG n=1 Tax=Salipaludibacillus daqingensis TaxID=3041001 RepID=UPI0024770420|nr:stage III sporulation protein AG [Salipaludibacillus daqingensis]
MTKEKKNETLFHSFTFKNKGKKVRLGYFLILIAVGVFLMILGSYLQEDDNDEPTMTLHSSEVDEKEEVETAVFKSDKEKENPEIKRDDFEYHYETQLKKALEEIVGVSNVSVMVNLAGSETNIYEKDTHTTEQNTEETDREGGTRDVKDSTKDEQVVIVRKGDQEEPLLIKTKKPEISGVLVVANGVDNVQVKTWVVEAISRVLDIPSHRVSVMPRKLEEDAS